MEQIGWNLGRVGNHVVEDPDGIVVNHQFSRSSRLSNLEKVRTIKHKGRRG